MDVLSLHQDQRKILEAVRVAVESLNLNEHLAIVGSLAEYLAGGRKPPGDIDMLIEEQICARYWEFVEILTKHGVNSVWEVYDPPNFQTWSPCHPGRIEHAMHFAVGSSGNYRGHKPGNLDLCFTVDNLAKIPKSARWVRREVPAGLSGADLDKAIKDGHRDFIEVVREREKRLLAPVFSEDVQLYYRLVDTSQANP
jgi:hypothetical protein